MDIRESYTRLKAKHPDAVLIFENGEEYQMLYEDAEIAERLIGAEVQDGIVHISREKLEDSIIGLVRNSQRVAICDRL